MNMKIALAVVVLAGSVLAAHAQQTRFCAPNGSSLGTVVPYGNGSVRYYDSRGNSLGTSTTTGNTTTFCDPRGNVTGRTVGPRVFSSRR
jgi:YD repeat-containing protein